MRVVTFLLLGCLSACMAKPPQKEASSFTPDLATLRALRETAEKVKDAEPARAAKISLSLARTRLFFFALAAAAREEKLLIVAGEAALALGPCAGAREDPCDLAILDRIERDLLIARQGGQEEEAKELAPLVAAMRKVAKRDAAGMGDLAALFSKDPFTSTAARLFALGRAAEAWEAASRSSATEVSRQLLAVAPLLCPEDKSCAVSKDIPSVYAAPVNARVLALADEIAALLSQLAKEPSSWGEEARTYALKPLTASFARPLPLVPIVPARGELKAPRAATWRESFLSLGGFSEILQTSPPRLYLSLAKREVSLGLAPGVQILDARPVLVDQKLGYGFPGKKVAAVDDAALEEALKQALASARAALKEAGLKESPGAALPILADVQSTAGDLILLAQALSAVGQKDLSLLVVPKDAPREEGFFVFGASIPLKAGQTEETSPAATLLLKEDGSGSLLFPAGDVPEGEGTAPLSFQKIEELLAYTEKKPLSFAPTLAPSPRTSVEILVGALDALRTASKGAWGPIEEAPLRIKGKE